MKRRDISADIRLVSVRWAQFALLVAVLWGVAAKAERPPAILTTARAAHGLTAGQSALALPVHLHAVVTYYDPYIDVRHGALFVHDDSGGIFVAVPARPILPLRAGTLIDLWGVTGPGDFAPIVDRPTIRVLGESTLPQHAPRASLSHMLTGADDSQWVEVEGVVRSVAEWGKDVVLELALRDGSITATTVKETGADYGRLVDAQVVLRGTAAPIFTRNRQMTGARLFFPNLSQLTVLGAAPADAFTLPAQPINSLLRF